MKKSKPSIGIWSCARTTSQRCPNKMIKNFCGTSLTDIFFKKLNTIQKKGTMYFLRDMKIFLKKNV